MVGTILTCDFKVKCCSQFPRSFIFISVQDFHFKRERNIIIYRNDGSIGPFGEVSKWDRTKYGPLFMVPGSPSTAHGEFSDCSTLAHGRN